jgi:predicted nucleic acid-binding protein
MPRPTAVYDANVLYSAMLRDLLMWLAFLGVVRARWTDEIHEEWIRNLADEANPKRTRAALCRVRDKMNEAVRDALVTGYEGWVERVELPDPDDRHVVAAAIEAKAEVIVTLNLKDFPTAALAPFEIEPLHPDEFLVRLFGQDPDAVCEAVRRQRANLKNPPFAVGELLARLADTGVPRLARLLEERAKEL